MSIGYPKILMNNVVVILALVIFIGSIYLLVFKNRKINKNLKILLGILVVIIGCVLGLFLWSKINSANISNYEKSQIKFSTGERYQFDDLIVKKVIDDNDPSNQEIVFKGTDNVEKMNKVIDILSTLELEDGKETLESIPDKNSLIIDFENGKDKFSITMYDSKPYVATGRYHYTLDEVVEDKYDFKALLSNTDLIKEILDIIE